LRCCSRLADLAAGVRRHGAWRCWPASSRCASRHKNSFAAGEIFIFLLLLMHGPAAATLAAAGEAFVGSYRTSKRWTSRIVSPAMAALAMGAPLGWLLHAGLLAPAWPGPDAAGLLVLATMGTRSLYFVLNTLLVSAVPRLKRRRAHAAVGPVRPVRLGRHGLRRQRRGGRPAVPDLPAVGHRRADGHGAAAGMLLATLHYFFRQQEAAEAVRAAGAEAAEREAELAERHVRELEASERRFHSAFTHASIGMALLASTAVSCRPTRRCASCWAAARRRAGRPCDFGSSCGDEDRAALEQQLGRS
jgi:hypothetical protein